MKKYTNIVKLLFGLLIVFSSCGREDFLDAPPKDQISEKQYWNSSRDAELYINKFYNDLSVLGNNSEQAVPYGDRVDTDNVFPSSNFSERLAGIRTVSSSGGGWSFSLIRQINYFLENYPKIEDNFDSYKQYVGEGYLFRAYFYFNLVKKFGDVPLITKTLNIDSDELYNPRTPRQQVIDAIIEDLDKAIEYMKSGPTEGGTRFNKEIAQLFKSRVCLYEGTWEKYHNGTVFGVTNSKSDEYLQMAADVAGDLIKSNIYSLYSTNHPEDDYFNVFNQVNYASHSEVMLWKKFDVNLDMVHRHQLNVTFEASGGITKNLADDYLCIDGLPKSISPLYLGDNTIGDVQTNRDPRLSQTVWGPGEPVITYGADTLFIWEKSPITGGGGGLQRNVGGYHVKKRANIHGENYLDYGAFTKSIVGSPVFRFAEALLNFAEAKAELNTISQSDLDISINKLRERVGMPYLELGSIVNDPDWIFPELSPIINEIRRERRVELALEDFRWDDLARWRAHEVFRGKRFYGAPWEPDRYPELNPGKDVYITEDNKYIDPNQKSLPYGYDFDPDRDYLDPIATEQLTLNPNLDQNPGW